MSDGPAMSPAPLRPKGKILLADDEAFFVDSLAERLRQENYECVVRADGLQVAAELNTATYDLLIADIRMPGNADLELIKLLSKLDDAVLAILVTAYPERVAAVKWAELPVISCLAKPVQFPELIEQVRRGVVYSTLFRCNRAVAQRLGDWQAQARADEQLLLRHGTAAPVASEQVAHAAVRHAAGCLADMRSMLDKLVLNGAAEQSQSLRSSIAAAVQALQ